MKNAPGTSLKVKNSSKWFENDLKMSLDRMKSRILMDQKVKKPRGLLKQI